MQEFALKMQILTLVNAQTGTKACTVQSETLVTKAHVIMMLCAYQKERNIDVSAHLVGLARHVKRKIVVILLLVYTAEFVYRMVVALMNAIAHQAIMVSTVRWNRMEFQKIDLLLQMTMW